MGTLLLTDPGFARATEVGEREFVVRRLHEWTLLRSIAVNARWKPRDVLAASDWFQRTAELAGHLEGHDLFAPPPTTG
ncbi:hypothetical protein [Nonomuraea sp. NPDC049684]|uniref:hypothetical protein n=1 Tax=Nonomuraea sp. NPDC049684 TaxID=3364356 RepID=UPI0037B1854A